MIKKIKEKIYQAIEKKCKDEFDIKRKQLENEFDIKRKQLENKNNSELEVLKVALELQTKALNTEIQEIAKKRKELDMELLETKTQFEKTNNELKAQIRLLEAKASPSNVWCEAFSSGFSKAFDLMQDIIKKGTQGIEDYFKEEAHIEALNNVGKIAEERINKIRDINLKQKFEIINKQEEFKKKMEKAAELGDKTAESRFKNYLTILDWMVNGDGAGNYS
jgi:hypothetical protein